MDFSIIYTYRTHVECFYKNKHSKVKFNAK